MRILRNLSSKFGVLVIILPMEIKRALLECLINRQQFPNFKKGNK